jgi:hypothetical protein
LVRPASKGKEFLRDKLKMESKKKDLRIKNEREPCSPSLSTWLFVQ